MKYGDKIIYMEGVIVEIHDGCVGIDLKGRLGYLNFVEQLGPDANEKYVSNLQTYQRRQEEMKSHKKNDEV